MKGISHHVAFWLERVPDKHETQLKVHKVDLLSCLHWHTPRTARVGLGRVSLDGTSVLEERVGKIKQESIYREKQSQSQTCCGIVPEAGTALAGLWTLPVQPGLGGRLRMGTVGLSCWSWLMRAEGSRLKVGINWTLQRWIEFCPTLTSLPFCLNEHRRNEHCD